MKDSIVLLLRSWKESLLIYVPKNFKLFLLVTIKSAVQTYGYLIYYFWWLLLLLILLDVGCYYPECLLPSGLWNFFDLLVKACCLLITFILARSSLSLKNVHYIIEQLYKSWFGFFLLYLIFYFLFKFFSYIFFALVLMPIFICALFFYLDTFGSLQDLLLSWWRGIMMYLFNAPFFLVVSCVVAFLWYQTASSYSIYGTYIFFLFVPFMVSYFKNMYVKRLHDQFNLYYAAR